MAGAGYREWVAGELITDAHMQNYLQDQVIMKFASIAERDNAPTTQGLVLAEGMYCTVNDTDLLYRYSGTAWVEAGGGASGTNFITNGDFSKWSLGTTPVALSTGVSFADRWILGNNGDSVSGSARQTFTPGTAPVAGYEGKYFARINNTYSAGAGNFTQYLNRIADVRTFAGQTVTFSYWAKADSAKSISIEAQQYFGTSGSANVNTFVAKQALTTSWTRYSHTFTVPAVTGKTINDYSQLDIRFWLSAGSTFDSRTSSLGQQNIVFDVWGVQLEAGSSATNFKVAGGLPQLDTVATGSIGFDGVLVGTGSLSGLTSGGTPAWAGYDVAGKNKVINGAFDIWQRGTSTTNPLDQTVNTADRWKWIGNGTGATRIESRQTFTPGAAPVAGYEGQYFYRLQQTVAGSGMTVHVLDNRIEDVRTFAGQTATLSFWAKADSARTLTANIQQDFGSGGSGQFSAGDQSYTLSTSWQRFTFTFNVPSVSGKTIGTSSWVAVRLSLPQNTTFTFDLWGVQLEAGSVATPFSRNAPSIQAELAACQRYCQVLTATEGRINIPGTMVDTTNFRGILRFPVKMRVAPSMSFSGGWRYIPGGSTATPASGGEESPDSILVTSTGFSASAGYSPILQSSDAVNGKITLTSEL